MAASFYVWDATQHNPQTTISTLEQAEYFATHPQDLGFTENLKNWLLDVEQIVTNPELAENFDEEIIQFFTNAKGYFNFSSNVFVIEYLQEKSKYLYKILVETLRKHNLVAFDAKHYVFFSRDVIFPDQKNIEQMLDAVQAVTKEQLEQFQAIPLNEDKLVAFAKQWLKKNQDTLHFTYQRRKDQYNERLGLYREGGKGVYENILILTASNPFGYKHICVTSYVQIKSNIAIRIFREHPINNNTLQYIPNIHGKDGKLSQLIHSEQLKNIFQQFHNFLIYDAEKHKDVETLNQWFNHGDEKEYITGLGVISRLLLAKYVNDPLYDQLVAEALPYVNRNRFFKNMTVEQFHERLEKEIRDILDK
ncbi:hypothetical protein ACE01U_10045 [Acinetobacter sp. BSP-153]|uniref:hypothetical protein n=1 Tax=Acinetobacter sp. BSP-153 TaxID=3344663 RepID=UPI00376F65AB